MQRFVLTIAAVLLLSTGSVLAVTLNVDDDADRDPLEDVDCSWVDHGTRNICTCVGDAQCNALEGSGLCDRTVTDQNGNESTVNDFDCSDPVYESSEEAVCTCTSLVDLVAGTSQRPGSHSPGTENASTTGTRPIPPPSPTRVTQNFSAPTGLRIEAAGGDRLRFTWRDNSNNESGFVIERLVPMVNRWVSFAEISGPGGDVGATSHTMRIEGARFPFCYRVRAVRGNTTTDPTERACAGLD